MTRGKDKRKRVVSPRSLANLKSLERVRPEGFLSCQSRFYADPVTVRQWQRLTPTERGELIELALRVRNG